MSFMSLLQSYWKGELFELTHFMSCPGRVMTTLVPS